jgi:hypothetical protein
MNNFLYVVIFLTLNGGCNQSNEIQEDVFEVSYEANTRGSSYSCILTNKSIKISSQGLDSKTRTEEMNKEDWNSLIKLINALNLNDLEGFTNSSNDFALDKARIAQLSISKNETQYQSSTFDEGNPPGELVVLINKILSLAETVE